VAKTILKRKTAGRKHPNFKIMTTQENPESSNKSTLNKSKARMLLSGTICAAITGLLFFLLFSEPEEHYTPEELYAANFEAYPDSLFPSEANTAAARQSSEQIALQLYQEEDYLSAIDSMTVLLAREANDDLRFYQSIAQLATDKNTDALINLSTILENKQSRFTPQARWYMALAYLKIGADEEAKVYLGELAKEENAFKSNRAAAILQILKEQEVQ